MSVLAFREGRTSDLRAAFELGEAAWDVARRERNLLPEGQDRDSSDIEAQWQREKGLLEFIVAQPDGCFLVCDDGDEMVGFARVARFGAMDELAELWVTPGYAGRGVGRALLERCWPDSPNPDLGRVVLGLGEPADLSLFTEFGVMPVGGHWHMRHRAEEYLERRSQEVDATEPAVHALTPERAVAEWKRLEPSAIGHERPLLHDFFGRTRTCLATMDGEDGQATAVCWVGSDGAIGPAVARESRGAGAGGAGRARPRGQAAGARDLRRVLHHRLLVAARPPAPPGLPGALAELADELGAAARPRPLPAHPPRPPSLKGLLGWLSRHRNGVAALAAVFVVWRVLRAALGGAWVLAGWDDIAGVGDWALEHWLLVALALAAVFVAVFFVVRSVIPWLERRERRRASG